MFSFLSCSYASVCSGCDWLLVSPEEQQHRKSEDLLTHLRQQLSSVELPAIRFNAIAPGGLRDRVDLMIDARDGRYRVGLFDRFRTGLVDLQGCPQLSPQLEAWFQDLRGLRFPIERGSIRLRVAPNGTRGIWLDFANVDIKRLLDERTFLDSLRSQAIVEIGQKRKRLVEKDGVLKLRAEPVLEPWFETYLRRGVAPLYATIGSFTQPGFQANRALINRMREIMCELKPRRAAEFGSGIGNFTLPLAEFCEHVDAYEIEEIAAQGLTRSLREQGLENRVDAHVGNFQGSRTQELAFADVDLLFVDPPRSGLMAFLDPLQRLEQSRRPRHVLYVSCFAESFAVDVRRLYEMGYRLDSLSIVDQFPQSRHYEIVALLSLK